MSAAAGLLQGIHSVIAMRRGPHWLLNDPDAKAYGLALANALRHLPVTMAQKYIDFTALGITIVAYEGPRIGIDQQLKAQRQQQARQSQQRGPMGQVFQFRPVGAEQPAQQAPQQEPAPPLGGMAPDMTYEPQMEGA